MSRTDRLRLAFLGLHPERARALVERHGSARRVLSMVRRGEVEGVRPSLLTDVTECTAAMERSGCRAVLRGDGEYPAPLAELEDAPDVLFVRGVVPAGAAVAIVGTRRCTAYGRRLAASFGRAVADAGWTVVSGLARGIDGAAHRGMLDAGGTGIAVLGSGSDVVYPRDHRDLHDALLDTGGAVVSEYPPGTTPHGWRFPPRNRIISGLAGAVVVVEAAVTGGALITAMRAAEQSRTVFAVPGDVDRAASVGCNLLIRDGAVPVLGPDDLIEALSLVLGPPAREVAAHAPVAAGFDERLLELTNESPTLDDLAERLRSPVSQVLAAVARLEIEGRVQVRAGRVDRASPTTRAPRV